ncbi:MAG: hypothetical protein MH252_05465 [Thermosynechococcaceae cyanobacterium MS004]|nr:hypothetical protein [Thermosynechococcaceae cyanobacterium MS004]
MVLYLLWAIANVLQNYGDRPYFTHTERSPPAFTTLVLEIAPLKQTLGHGDRY